EAHLLFSDGSPALIEKVERVVRLIRSKGVGIYFVTQSPLDIPDTVLAQLGNRIQHALRAYTPREQKAVKTAADTFRQNPEIDTAEAITQLGVGEALVSTLEDKGIPAMVQRTLIRPPASRMGPLRPDERMNIMAESPVRGLYDRTVDRESAYEMLAAIAKKAADDRLAEQSETEAGGDGKPARSGRRSDTALEAGIKSVVRSIASSVGRQIANTVMRGILGSLSRR
ncbi:MAG TPA: helicase HerA-like domain-containing protein, partial [Aestuariivirgaceae bacterium]|nr:helicase HerA-like domain-containing protein [Aestuariivirgaceae bacterium]